MPTFLLCHRHAPGECGYAFAAWNGFDSLLRRRSTLGGCLFGDHNLFWVVEADGVDAARALLPEFVAARTEVHEVRPVAIP